MDVVNRQLRKMGVQDACLALRGRELDKKEVEWTLAISMTGCVVKRCVYQKKNTLRNEITTSFQT